MSSERQFVVRRRLESWKEIAVFFDRDERTVSRWEKEHGLPVYRLPGAKGRVYAYSDELSAWSSQAKTVPAGSSSAGGGAAVALISESSPPFPIEAAKHPSPAVPTRLRSRLRVTAEVAASVVAMGFLLFTATKLWQDHGQNNSKKNSNRSVTGAALNPPHPHNPEAEQLYLKGRYYWDKRTPDDLNRALDYFMQAVVLDPKYSQAYSGLADAYDLLREYSMMPADEAYHRAAAAARRAVELDDRSSEAHASLGFVSFFGEWDLAKGDQEFRRAIELNPNNSVAHHWYANALLAMHRMPEALAEINKAQELEPASSAVLADKANILCASGRHDDAISVLKQMENSDPGFRSVHLYLRRAYLRKGDWNNFVAEQRADAEVLHDKVGLAISSAAERGLASGGREGMFLAMLTIQKKLYAEHQVSPFAIAETLSELGREEEAIGYLRAAHDQRDGSLLFIESDVEFNPLIAKAAYRELLHSLRLPPADISAANYQ